MKITEQLSLFVKIKSIVDLCVLVRHVGEVITFVKLNESQNSSNIKFNPSICNINIEVPHDNEVFMRLTGFTNRVC